MRKLLFLLCVFSTLLFLVTCGKKLDQPSEEPSITLSTSSISTDNAGGRYRVQVLSITDWTVESDADWCSVNPTSGSNKHWFSIEVSPSIVVGERVATITVSSGTLSKTVTVTQTTAKIFEVTPTTFTVDAADINISVTVKTNQEYEITYPSTSWISLVSTTGESLKTVVFKVEANTTNDDRTGTIVFCAGDQCYNVTVNQKGKAAPTLTISESTVLIGNIGGTHEIQVQSNTDWTVASNMTWCTVSPTGGSNNGAFTLTLTSSTAIEDRVATITVTAGTLSKTVIVTQAKAKVFEVTPTTFSIDAAEKNISVTVTTNQEYEITYPSTPWISLVSTTGESVKTVVFKVEANTTNVDRTGTIVFCAGEQCYNVTVNQSSNAPWITKDFYHKSLAMRFTATWCGYCPQMDAALMDAMVQKPNKIEYVALHASSSALAFSGTQSLYDLYGIDGYPNGIMDGRGLINNYTVQSTTTGLFVDVLEETELAYPTVTSTAFFSVINGNTIDVDVELYAKVADNYKITVLLLEDNIINYQNGGGDDYVHNSVARVAFSNVLGDAATITNPNVKWKKSYTATIPTGCNKNNLRVLVYVQRPFGTQTVQKTVPSVIYGDYGGYYVDNANSAKAGEGTEVIYIGGNNESIGITDPIG